MSGREQATTTRAPKPARARTRSRPKAGPVAAPPAPTPAAERIGVVHLTAEYWPFARTGGLGEAVSGLATFQAAAGMPTTVVLPLYRQVRATAPSLERAGPPFTATVWPVMYRHASDNKNATSGPTSRSASPSLEIG